MAYPAVPVHSKTVRSLSRRLVRQLISNARRAAHLNRSGNRSDVEAASMDAADIKRDRRASR